jgi:hypothetical protein
MKIYSYHIVIIAAEEEEQFLQYPVEILKLCLVRLPSKKKIK